MKEKVSVVPTSIGYPHLSAKLYFSRASDHGVHRKIGKDCRIVFRSRVLPSRRTLSAVSGPNGDNPARPPRRTRVFLR